MRAGLSGRDKEQYVNKLFATVAPKYDLLNSVISVGRHKSWRRIAVKMAALNTGNSAIDVACGTGDFAFELSKAVGSNGSVVATDFCVPMIDLASVKLAKAPNITLAGANAQYLPFSDDSFDCATIGFGLRNVASVPSTISEMTRVIKPGGRVISLEILGPSSRYMKPLWDLYFGVIMPKVALVFGGKREPYRYLPESVVRFYSRKEVTEIFESCGLTDVKIRNLMFGTVCIHIGTKK